MRRLLLAAVLAAVTLIPMSAAHADSYCFQSGLKIFGEPYLGHRQCVTCPLPGGSCPWISEPTLDPIGPISR
ncbi:MAG: hypothetical protein NVSMB57_02200 [Actinomycetota bacterium]